MISRRALGAYALIPALASLHAQCAIAADAPPLLAQVRTRLVDAPVLRGAFEQRKTVRGFKHPLVSRGDFIVWRDHGVVWRTQEPLATTLVVTRDKLVSRQADGQATATLDATKEPALRAINDLLFALLAADLPALAARFAIDGSLQGERGWQLALKPRDAMLARWLTRVDVEGEQQVRVVTLLEASGDETQIRLARTQTAATPTADEAARFD